MRMLRQIIAAARLGLSTLPQRWKGALAVVAALTVVTVAMNPLLILADSFIRAYSSQGYSRAVVSEPGKRWIFDSHLPAEWVEAIKRAPGIARGPDGRPMADSQAALHCGALIRIARDCVHLIGMEPAGFAMRPEMKLVKGRLPRPGRRELVVGAMVASPALAPGRTIRLLDRDWLVTGTFVTGTVLFDRDAIADSATLRAATRAPGFNHVVVRLASPDAFDQLRNALQGRSDMNVIVEREEEHFRRSSGQLSLIPRVLSYLLGTLLGLGALAGIFHTMHAAVEARYREIAVMRAVGFAGGTLAAAIALEAMLLAAIGTLLGMLALWFWLDGDMFRGILLLSVTPARMGLALGWALAIALLGALSPALGVARMEVAEALKR